MDKIAFDSAKTVETLEVLKEEHVEIDNHFVHVLIEDGVNLSDNTYAKAIVFDNVWCFNTKEATEGFIAYLQAYNK